jgi:predicted lipoprotein with Yx(FWY)xxD motif
MKQGKCYFMPAACLIAIWALAACGTTPTTNTSTPAPGKATYQPPSAPFIQIATATVENTPKKILTTAPGLTLYYFTLDTTTSACQGSCTTTWRPLSFAGTGTPIAPSTLPGTLSLITTANGNQVAYNGHPLYTYIKDTLPGQANGEGLLGKWFVATPDLPER